MALEIDRLAAEVAAIGARIGLPCIAASADIGSPAPIRDSHGKPFAGQLFKWVDPDLRYWEDRGFALRSYFIHAVRVCSEPIFYHHGRLASWRETHALDAINAQGPSEKFGVGAAIIAPAYLPAGVIGAVVWATADTEFDIEPVFHKRATQLQALALRFVATEHERSIHGAAIAPASDAARDSVLEMGRRWKDRFRDQRHHEHLGANRALPHDQRRAQARRRRPLASDLSRRHAGLCRRSAGARLDASLNPLAP